MKKAISILLTVLFVLQCSCLIASGDSAETDNNTADKNAQVSANDGSFLSYYEEYADKASIAAPISFNTDSIKAGTTEFTEKDGTKATAIAENAAVQFEVEVQKDGIYPFAFRYYNSDESDSDYMLSVAVDGKLPYSEAEYISLPRVWRDNVTGEYSKDEKGNEIRPVQENVNIWTDSYAEDTRGFYKLPYFVYLTAGKHSITLTSQKNTFIIGSLILGMKTEYKSYAEYSGNAKEYGGDSIKLQAEKTNSKSNSSLYPTYDRTNSATEPQSASCILLNTVGKSNWTKIGDYISWKPEIESAGWYKISVRARQNTNQGMYSYRTLRINGEIPFDEVRYIAFPYNSDWYIKTFGGDEPYLFYLEPGDEISLSVTTGPISDILRSLNHYTTVLNKVYREVIAITGTSPDTYRDYMLDSQLPELENELADISAELTELSKKFEKLTGTKGSQASIIDYVISVLNDFADDCNEIPNRLTAFQSALGNLGTLINTLSSQPLELDYFIFYGSSKELKANNNWAVQTWFSLKTFAASFSSDYSTADKSDTEKSVNVWASVGRDQAKIINNLIRNSFTPEYNTKINFSIVDASVLIKASLAGKGPDVALLAGVPLELAARGALVPLSDYDLSPIKDEFNESIWEAMSYNGKIYALPETMTFYMMFYRKDILEEYGVKVPETWDDFYKAVEELQKNNLTIGIPEVDSTNYGVSQGIGIFNMFFLQRGGSYYNDKRDKVLFNTEEAFSAFEEWVNIHKLYSNGREFDFYSRFRTGEMPLAIQLYTAYNQISSAAPEIQGLWDMAIIPGTLKSDGTVDKTQAGTVTGCYMLKSAVKKGVDKEAFEFMRWWVSSDIQTKYGKELEATLGVAARHTPANIKALNNLGWSATEKATLNKATDYVITLPQVPGNYLMQRSLTTAFRTAVMGKNRARRALTIANKEINDELTRKREEFGLNKKDGE